MNLFFIVLAGFCVLHARADEASENGCTFHQDFSCDERATCVDLDLENNTWKCVCPEGVDGDGLKGDNHTGCGEKIKTCKLSDDCHPLATCNATKCTCNIGYQGDGWENCTDIDECLTKPCHPKAYCNNTDASYLCTCNERENYIGNGTHCEHTCTLDDDCYENEHCVGQVCSCKSGYKPKFEEDGCENIDECVEENPCDGNATCTDREGSFDCTCNNGFTGDGVKCKKMPMNCDDIKQADLDSNSGWYEIDPDFEGPLENIEVQCDMRKDFGITILPTKLTKAVRMRTTFTNYKITYNHTVADIKAVINSSQFCFQNLKYECRWGATLMNGDDYLEDGDGNKINAFASTVDGMCPCGQMTYCRTRSSNCNCDGNSDYGFDEGKILDMKILPITRLVSNPNRGRGDATFGAVRCAPKPHDFPKDCHDAKFTDIYNVQKDGPQHIDIDGEDGLLNPVLVHCDVETERHVGITVVPTSAPEPIEVTQPGDNTVYYGITDAHLQALVDESDHCTQEAGYECQNSALLNNGEPKKGYFWDIRGDEKDYWPTGLGHQYKCGCGVLRNCANESNGCNCDTKDGVLRKDFGLVTDKEDLPIGKLTFLDVGGVNQIGRYHVGDLRCSQKQFGIPPTCQDIVNDGQYDSHPYVIDPDGPPTTSSDTDNQDPFLVYCEMTSEPPTASTIVYNNQGSIKVTAAGEWSITYKQAITEQLTVLIDRSVSCMQTIQYSCRQAPLHDENGTSIVTWETRDARWLSYFDGIGGEGKDSVCQCGLTEPNTCIGEKQCNCDLGDNTLRVDVGLLTNKFDVPMMTVKFGSIEGSADFTLGPLECRDLHPNCADLKIFRNSHKLIHEYDLEDGFYTINPSAELGVEAFLVECRGTQTLIPTIIDPSDPLTDGTTDEPVSKCYKVNYRTTYEGTHYELSPEQIQALVNSSNFCSQKLDATCLNAPLMGFSNYSTCDGEAQPGWAGSQGRDECACGIVGKCKGGPESSCNCDLEDGQQSEDGAWEHDKNYLAVCQVCVGLDRLSNLDPSVTPRKRLIQPSVSDLVCDSRQIGNTGSCMDWRNAGMKESGVQMVDPDNGGPSKNIPIYCGVEVYPPLGYEIIEPKEPEHEIPPEGTVIDVIYWIYTMESIKVVIENAGYCTQNVTLVCENASLVVNGTYGWYSADGELQTYWAGNEQRTTGCEGETGECNCNLPGFNTDGGLIVDDKYVDVLPVSGFVFGPSNGTRTLKVGPVKCFNLPVDCHDILKKNLKRDPLGNSTYTIDPDQGGGVPYFPVTCDFTTDTEIGITELETEIPPGSDKITGSPKPKGTTTTIPVKYVGATYEQVHALAEISGYCFEGIQYSCIHAPLLNFGDPESPFYYTTFGGVVSPSFGVAGQTDDSVCACYVTNSCPEGFGCHCDAQGPMATVDYGYLITNDILPIEAFHVRAISNPNASATFDVTNVRCGPRPFDLPKDCQEAYESGKKTGEVLIQPNPNVDPFLVHCNMDRGFGVTVISNTLEDGQNVTFGEPILVDYYGATKEQIEALAEVSIRCYTPFKYECQHTRFLAGDGFYHWNNEMTYVGDGRYYKNECNCGSDGENGQCGGSEDKDYLLNNYRPCNCDANDAKQRVDGGVFNSSSKLPIVEMLFKDTGNPLAVGMVTLGKLYCADFDFDLDECTLGFDDCDEHATCTNQHGNYKCRCQKGWQALGRHDKWANGRDCYDDDECALNDCPSTSNCTNTPGSFYCVCHDGYEQLAPTTCKDIDECKIGTDDCDVNARCINLPGTYACKCNRNYRGDGKKCEPLAECSCFGDPHCLTSDSAIIDYQGTCQYVMARDKCHNLGSQPSFELLIKTEERPEIPTKGQVSYVKEAIFRLPGFEISLLQDHVVWVNGDKVNLPYRKGELFHISRFGDYVEVYTHLKVEVVWDGDDYIEIRTPGTFKGDTCGFCGNYNDNPDDDLILGPSCPDVGNQTDNFFQFGNSWADETYVVDHPECSVNCTPKEEPECKGLDYVKAKQACKVVWDKHGKFMKCLEVMDPSIKSKLEKSCIYDVCNTGGDSSGPVCDSAEMLYQECLNLEVDLTNFRSDDFCGMDCEENMEYLPAGPVNQMTCMDFLNGTEPKNAEPPFTEGCFCKEGFVMDVDECIDEDDCGCVYNDQYYKVGDEITLDNCGSKGTCYANHSVLFDDITCDENATCTRKEGRYGCHCKDGFYGDGTICKEDTCKPNPCGENETCVRNSEKDEGYECLCAMGFMGNCKNCTEIDECATGTDGCPYHAYCINTVGSFRCECIEGFYMYNGQCEDIDECSVNDGEVSVCGNNSRCSNKIGTFNCPCCDGYESDDNGTCVEKPGAIGEAICCVCDIDICNEPGEVCGEDFQSYDSIADMIVSNCEKGLPPRLWQQVEYFGNCTSGCNPDPCPKYQQCVMNQAVEKPICECEPCTKQELESEVKVCSKEFVIYKNYCEFKKIQCEMDTEVEIYPDMKPCEDRLGNSLVGPWTPWSPCSVTCGTGEQTKTRNPLKPLTPEEAEMFPLELSKKCYEDPCPGSVCVNYTCPHIAAECEEGRDGKPKCVCPDCENDDVEPVCGFVTDIVGGPRPITWKSECTLLAFVCNNDISDFEYMHEGHCGSEPKDCTRVPDMQFLSGGDNNTYTSTEKHSLNKCVGGCGQMKDDCCQPVKTKTVNVPLKKGSDIIFEKFDVIKECECVDIGDEPPN